MAEFGHEFETLAAAYISLKLIDNDHVEDFSVDTNVKEHDGNLDDLLFEIKPKNQEKQIFAIELKHSEINKPISPDDFHQSKHVDLTKCCETVSKFHRQTKKFHTILYSTRPFDHNEMGELVKPQENYPADTAGANNIHKFDDKTSFDEFFENVAQYSSGDFQNEIKKIFNAKYAPGQDYLSDGFIAFFRDWRQQVFTNNKITKEIVVNTLLGLLLSNCLIKDVSLFESGYENLLEKAVNSFDITLVEGLKDQHLVHEHDNISCDADLRDVGQNLKLVKKNLTGLSKEQKDSILRFSGKKPFLIKFNEGFKSYIQAALEVLGKNRNRKHKLKLVIIGKKIDSSQLSWNELMVLENLHDLHKINASLFDEIMQKFQISLQGKKNICMKDVIHFETAKLIKIADLLKCWQGILRIGEKTETVVVNYMPRFVTAPCFSPKFLLKLESDLSVINCGEQLEQVEDKFWEINYDLNKTIMLIQEIDDTNSHKLQNEIILTGDDDLLLQKFRKDIAKFKGNVHYFKAVDENSFQWIQTEGDIQSLRSDDTLKTNKVAEGDIFTNCKNKVNVICAEPGMGKSVMMERLKISCPPDFWTVKVDCRKFESTFEEFTDKFDDDFTNFKLAVFQKNNPNNLQIDIVHVLTEQRKVYFLFDGLDELQSRPLEKAINFLKNLSSTGFMFWISAQKNLQDKLEKEFNALALNIEEISTELQKDYVKQRLQVTYEQQEIQEVISKVFTNVHDVLGIPSELSTLTEILIEEKKPVTVTKMYESFFRGKVKHYLDKIKSHNYEEHEELVCRHYEKAALKSCLDDDFFHSLNVQDFDECLKFASKDNSRIGIIKEIVNGRPIFVHNTYGEYFAACYFAKNYEKVWQKHNLFQTKYKNIRFMLDIKLADNSTPHLSVIYKDLDKLKEFDKKQINCKDRAGRTPLHLACSYGETFPFFKVDENIIQDGLFPHTFELNESNLVLSRNIVKYLLENNCDPFENDDFLKFNAIQYADAYLNLSALEEILELNKRDNQIQFMENFKKNLSNYSENYSSIIYYCAKFGFINLFHFVRNLKFPLFSTLLKIRNRAKETLLHIVVKNKQCEMVQLILSESVPKKFIKAGNYLNETALHYACHHGPLKTCELLINSGASVNAGSSETPLFASVRHGHLDIMNLLLTKGANVNYKGNSGYDSHILHIAVYFDNVEALKILLDAGADVSDKTEEFGKDALHLAVERDNINALKILLNAGADIGSKDYEFGKVALHLAVENGNMEAVKILLEAKADIRAKDYDEEEALHVAAYEGNIEALKILLDAGADIKAKNSHGKQALHYAAANAEALKILLDAGADITARTDNGEEVLHFAALNGNVEALKFLLNAGADVKAKDNHGKGVFHFPAAETYYIDIEAWKIFLNAGADINAKDDDGQEALHVAARSGNFEMLKFLLDSKADIRAEDKLGRQLLHMAALGRGNKASFLKLIHDLKADLNAVTYAGESVLHLAVGAENYRIVELLINLKVNVNAEDNNGKTPLQRAKSADGNPFCIDGITDRNRKIMKILIDAGATM